jgi:peptide deformylase
MEKKMSDTIVFNTEESTKSSTLPQPTFFQLVSENHPILRQVIPEFDFTNPPVNANEFASSLVETCKLHHGIGLSANQCGFPYRVFVMGSDDNYVAFFNPELINVSKEEVHMVEGCLSFPFLALRITRPAEIGVRYQDFNGEWKGTTLSGISARAFLHELDHMNGIVYTDKVKPMALQSGMNKRSKIIKKLRIR